MNQFEKNVITFQMNDTKLEDMHHVTNGHVQPFQCIKSLRRKKGLEPLLQINDCTNK